MKCPICGCKMPNKSICVYCKITGEEVESASNLKAKQCIKEGKTDKVVNSTTIPKDINRVKLTVLAVLLGMVGGDAFYIGKRYKGLYELFSWVLYIPFAVAYYSMSTKLVVLQVFMDIFMIFAASTLIIWIANIFALIFKSYSVPVILPDSAYAKQTKKVR